ncbi:uncharacterized protein RAG0_11150 [Rhynchosporium agropyri]|uniref:Uncharacterized protein n=1 Tax=Rhynchosporium agropyri TaxID=914238 RepID=A0A1E1L2W4_9HELO|nr:uncharacterized protein RAG0_11150 [Rhynchosporium agropyri]
MSQTGKPVNTLGGSRSAEEKASRKAEKKTRKQERKQKRDIKRAAAHHSTPAQPTKELALSEEEEEDDKSVRPVTSNTGAVGNGGLKSARAHYSPISARVSSKELKIRGYIPDSENEGSGSDEGLSNHRFDPDSSPISLTKDVIAPTRSADERILNPLKPTTGNAISPETSTAYLKRSRSNREFPSPGTMGTKLFPPPRKTREQLSKQATMTPLSNSAFGNVFEGHSSKPVSNISIDDFDLDVTQEPSITDTSSPGTISNTKGNGAEVGNLQWPTLPDSDSDTDGSIEETIVFQSTKDTNTPGSSGRFDFSDSSDSTSDSITYGKEIIVTHGTKVTANDVRIKEKIEHSCSGSDSEMDGSVEETIITQGAKNVFSRTSEAFPEYHLQAMGVDNSDDSDADEMSEDEEMSNEDEMSYDTSIRHRREPLKIMPAKHAGFPPPEELPSWFPTNIKQIYKLDRHGGALSFEELNQITRYRAALEKIRRQKWKTYLEAGEARFKLQKILRRLRVRPLTRAFYQYRMKQYGFWKEEALKSWKRLEKTHVGIRILDETIDINVRQEGMIYKNIEKNGLGGRV